MATRAKIPCKTKQYPMVIQGLDNENALTINDEGYVFVNKIAILDSKTGKYWDITIEDGKVVAEPHGLEEKRDYKINKIIS